MSEKKFNNIKRYKKDYLGDTSKMSLVVMPLRMQIHLQN